MQADTVVNNGNALLKVLLLDSAKSVGALKHKRKPEFVPRNDWFDNDCQIRRRIYSRKLREANKTSNPCERKAAAKEYKLFLLQKKSKRDSDTNQPLRQKNFDNLKEYWSFFKRLSRELNNIPVNKSKLYDHFKCLNNALEAPQNLVNLNDDDDDLNVPITESEVRSCMKKVKNGKSAGLDDIYPEFIKYVPEELVLMITTFFNKIPDIGIVPDDWATSIYQPIFKKGEKMDPNNYRGISLASCVCKLFASVLTERIQKDLEKRGALGLEEAGFRNNTGCIDHVSIISSIMSTYLAQKKKLFVTIIDYEKAFDKVDHGVLWQKLGEAKITGKVLGVIQSPYQKTKALVRVNGELTDVFDCNIGVRQGDKLSPLLFIIFLNDFNNLIRTDFEGICLNAERSEELTTFLKMYSLLYADDTLQLSETDEDMQRAFDATLKIAFSIK